MKPEALIVLATGSEKIVTPCLICVDANQARGYSLLMTTTNTTLIPGRIYEKCSMDYTSLIHYAVTADGRAFTRTQYRDPRYGYKWGAWRETSLKFVPTDGRNTERNARLPKAV